MFGQTVQTQIRLLLEEHCLLFHLHHLTVLHMVEPLSLNFQVFTLKLVGVKKFRNFIVVYGRAVFIKFFCNSR